MLESILKFNKKNFYQDKVDAIGAVIRQYAECRQDRPDSDETVLAKNHALEVISSIIRDCGFSGQGNSYIAIEREFFSDKGILDERKLSSFQKEIVKQYGIQQIKWSFAGTTLNFTQMTKQSLKNQGQVYEDLLPFREQHKQSEERVKKYLGDDPTIFRAFLYSDGSMSEKIIPEKMKVRFDILQDQSGFDWSGGYSPDNQVKKKDWGAGFNKQGTWEKFLTISSADSHIPSQYRLKPVDVLSETGQPDSIRLLHFEDTTYLLDDFSSLYAGAEEFYYSVTGELYGARKVDREKTLTNLKKSLSKKGMNNITGVVLHRVSKEAVAFYKKALSGFITKKTRFYSRNDKEFLQKMEMIRIAIEGNAVSKTIVSDIAHLSKRGLKQEELFQSLSQGIENRFREIPLHIFEDESQLETFLALPPVREICEDNVADYLKNMEVPREKRTAVSNAVQNLLYNYREIFKHKQVNQLDVIRAAQKLLVDNDSSPVLDSTLTAEESLYAVIQKAAKVPVRFSKNSPDLQEKKGFDTTETTGFDVTAIFMPVTEKTTYKDIFSEQGLMGWITEDLAPVIPAETVEAIKNTLETITIPDPLKNTFSITAQNILPYYPSIAASTGSTPNEIINYIQDVLLDRPGAEPLKGKRVFFEKSLKNIIKQCSVIGAPGIKEEKGGILHEEIAQIQWKPFSDDINLFGENDLAVFLSSPIIEESGFTKEEAIEITGYIKSLVPDRDVPEYRQKEFSRGIINLIRGYHFQLKPSGVSIIDAIDVLKETVSTKRKRLEKKSRQSEKKKRPVQKKEIDHTSNMRTYSLIKKIARINERGGFLPEQETLVMIGDSVTLNSILEKGPDHFLSSDLVTENAIPEEDALRIFHYLKDISIPGESEQPLMQALIGTLKKYASTSQKEDGSAFDAVKKMVASMKGKGKSYSPGQDFPAEDASAESGIHEIPTLNLLNKQDFITFTRSDIFKTSGLNPDHLASIIREYRDARHQKKNLRGNLFSVPLTYDDTVLLDQPEFLKSSPPVSLIGTGAENSIENNVYNIGFTITTYPGQDPVVLLTKQGRKALSGYKQEKEQGSVEIEFAKDITQEKMEGSAYNGEQGDGFPYLFSYSKSSVKYPGHTPSVKTNRQESTGFQQNTHFENKGNTISDQGVTRHQRIENNYYNDKKMLARSSSESILGKSSGKKKTKTDNENVIKQMSDDLVEEMVNKAKEEGL